MTWPHIRDPRELVTRGDGLGARGVLWLDEGVRRGGSLEVGGYQAWTALVWMSQATGPPSVIRRPVLRWISPRGGR